MYVCGLSLFECNAVKVGEVSSAASTTAPSSSGANVVSRDRRGYRQSNMTVGCAIYYSQRAIVQVNRRGSSDPDLEGMMR